MPALASNLPNDLAASEAVFEERVRARFAGAVTEQQLMEDLRTEGFSVSAATRVASFRWESGSCTLVWFVDWEVDEGMVVGVAARHGAQCL